MMEYVWIKKLNELHIQVIAEPGLIREISDYFTFTVPGAQFMPAYKNKYWDGKIRLLNQLTGVIYAGLAVYIIKFCRDRGYEYEIDPELTTIGNVKPDEIENLAKVVECVFSPRDYQRQAIAHCLNHKRALLLSPTASGKSLIIYLLAIFHIVNNRRVLLVVPNTGLVYQMSSDFVEYNHGRPVDIHQITAGKTKLSDAAITITTWQSVYKMEKEWFKQFDVIVGDEAHLFKAKSLMKIMERTDHIKYRYGLTGTLDGTETNKLILEGLFGPIYEVTKTEKLIKEKTLADFSIKGVVLQYSSESRQEVSKMNYQREINWLVNNKARNDYIVKLAQALSGNTLILFQFVDKHGKILLPMLENGSHNIHFVHGGINTDERERIRRFVEDSEENNTILASYGTFSTGTNIKRLNNIILASPSKSRIRVLQSIGRGLRKGNGKAHATLYDIADDLKWKNRQNFAARHFQERVNMYHEQGFNLSIYNVTLKE